MEKKKGFWKKYYEAKNLSGKEFYKRRFLLIEMAIISLLVVTMLSFVDLVSYNWPDTYETQQIKSYILLFIFIGVILFYRYHLYKLKYKKKA